MSTSQESSVRKPVRSFRLKRKEGTGEEKDNNSNSRSSSSEATQCTICHGDVVNRCCGNSCSHQFCFECLKKWSEVKAECPLCKTSFRSIYHNFRSGTDADDNEHDEYVVPPRPTTTAITIQYTMRRGRGVFLISPAPRAVDNSGTSEFQDLLSMAVDESRPRMVVLSSRAQAEIVSPPPEPDVLNFRMSITRVREDTRVREGTRALEGTRVREETQPREGTRRSSRLRESTRRSSSVNKPYTLRSKTQEQQKPSK